MKYAKFFRTSILLLLCALLGIVSCEDILEPDKGDPVNPIEPVTIDPNVASEYLVLANANRITGELATVPANQVEIDVEDTIFTVKSYPVGNRVRFRHPPELKVSGFYIYLPGADFYFDVPKHLIENQLIPPEGDTITTLVIDMAPPEDADYPYTVDVKIVPHDEAGMGLAEFEREIQVEDPEDNPCANICGTPPDKPSWQWDFTLREYNDSVLNYWAPGLSERINEKGYGCCYKGESVTPGESPHICYDSSQVATWVEVDVYDYYVRLWEFIQCEDDQDFTLVRHEINKQYFPQLSDFCESEPGYEIEDNFDGALGSHDYVAGGDRINISFDTWPFIAWRPRSFEIVHTCNSLLLFTGGEDKFMVVYKKYESVNDLFQYEQKYYHK